MKVYLFYGHVITLDDHDVVRCRSCSIPKVIEQAVLFMSAFNVTLMIIDGVEIRRRT